MINNFMNNTLKPLGIYIHIPFCVRKCVYCDFLSFPSCDQMAKNEEVYKDYTHSLCLEIAQKCEMASQSGYYANTVYIGGGTPSVLPLNLIAEITDRLDKSIDLGKVKEFTIECNPKTADLDKFRGYKALGINRISMGVQSFDDEALKLLGRIHTSKEAIESYELARKAGFENINLDLMSSLPGQSTQKYEESLKLMTSLEPEHISSYSLIVEENTPLANNLEAYPPLVSEEEDRLQYALTEEILKLNNYSRYEISNYSRPGYESIHNSSYWTRVPYLGLGLGASSFYEGRRFHNTEKLNLYLTEEGAAYQPCDEEIVEKKDAMAEFMFLGLRLLKGIAAEDFEKEFGTDILQVYGDVLKDHIKNGVITHENGRYKLTSYGIDVSNMVFSDYIL